MDTHSPEQRSYNMSRIRGKDTQPELLVRRWLWKNGYRYRLHRTDLPGKPDIVMKKYKAVILVHGCFWHRHGCKLSSTPTTHQNFWHNKFRNTVDRDQRNISALLELSWRVMVIWECSLSRGRFPSKELSEEIRCFLNSDLPFTETGIEQKSLPTR